MPVDDGDRRRDRQERAADDRAGQLPMPPSTAAAMMLTANVSEKVSGLT